jgi:alpha-ketoglutarate-dependent taurine dioxygenase
MEDSSSNAALTHRRKAFLALKTKPVSVSPQHLVQMETFSTSSQTPLVITPNFANVNLADWIAHNRALLSEKLAIHGGLLFRGFALHSQEDFQHVLQATEIELISYNESSTPRKQLSKQVYTSTEFPADQTIALHNELSTAATLPLSVWFFALQPAQKGGETPIADIRNVYKRLSGAVQSEFKKRGWMLIRNYNDGFGLSWQDAFHTMDRAIVEEYCRNNAIAFEWKDQDRLRTRQVRPAIAIHPKTGETVWFNHLVFWHVSSLEATVREAFLRDFGAYNLPYETYYGDGGRISDSVVEEIRAAYREEKVVFVWEPGDLLMLDNMLVAHGRQPYVGPRRILVGMGEPYTRTDL